MHCLCATSASLQCVHGHEHARAHTHTHLLLLKAGFLSDQYPAVEQPACTLIVCVCVCVASYQYLPLSLCSEVILFPPAVIDLGMLLDWMLSIGRFFRHVSVQPTFKRGSRHFLYAPLRRLGVASFARSQEAVRCLRHRGLFTVY